MGGQKRQIQLEGVWREKESKQSSKSRLRGSKDWGQEKDMETRVKRKRTDKKNIDTCDLKGGSG